MPSPRALWNQCEHLSWYFLPWHGCTCTTSSESSEKRSKPPAAPPTGRCRTAHNPGGESAKLPDSFRNPANPATNPLYVADRVPTYNNGNPLPNRVINQSLALARPAYIGNAEFGGHEATRQRLLGPAGAGRGTPHNNIQPDGGLMGNPNAAQDPILAAPLEHRRIWLHPPPPPPLLPRCRSKASRSKFRSRSTPAPGKRYSKRRTPRIRDTSTSTSRTSKARRILDRLRHLHEPSKNRTGRLTALPRQPLLLRNRGGIGADRRQPSARNAH